MKIVVDLGYQALVALGVLPRHPLFDSAYYLAAYPDVAAAGMDPYRHYLRFGIAEGRMPNAWFDTRYYLSQVRGRPRDPTRHYLLFGAAAGLDPHPLFETRWYLERYPDVARSRMNPLRHYLAYGVKEGRETAPRFRRAFGAIEGFTRTLAETKYRRFAFGLSGPVPDGIWRDRIVVMARLRDGPRQALAKALSLAAAGLAPEEIVLETPPPLAEGSIDPTVALVFANSVVQRSAEAIKVDHAELRLYFIDPDKVQLVRVVPAGSFSGLR
jgi:hypothetical protein